MQAHQPEVTPEIAADDGIKSLSPDSEADTSATASPEACDQGCFGGYSAFIMSNQLLKNTAGFPQLLVAACL